MKYAIVFPGQASQEVGMGMELKNRFSYVAELFQRANDILGFDISSMIESGPIEELTKTENAQPSILLVSQAAYLVLKNELEIKPDFLIGHSLGEYNALVAANAVDFDDAIKLVKVRGRLMQEACPVGEGAMAAVIGLSGFQAGILVDKARGDGQLDLANYNAPSQLVISGSKAAVDRACEIAPTLDAKRCIPLNVSAPFHSSLMIPAAEKFNDELAKVNFRAPEIPVLANYDANLYSDAASIPKLLTKQIPNPVLYYQSVIHLLGEGMDAFIEVGPGKVLTGLNRRIISKERGTGLINFGKPDEIDNVKALITGGAADA